MPKSLQPHSNDLSEEFSLLDYDHDLAEIREEESRNAVRALVFGLPARPGTKR